MTGAPTGTLEGAAAEPSAVPPPGPPAPRRSRLALHPGVVVLVGAMAVLVRHVMHTGLAGDVYFHLAAGNWMLDHHHVIRADVFSYTVHGRTWLADEWGFELGLAWLVREIGPTAYWLVSAGSCAGAVLAGAFTWRRAGAGWLWTAVLSCLATAGLLVGLAVRPQDVSYLFFALELLLLALARGDRRWLVALPPLLLVWANVHGSFLLGLGVLVLEVIWSLLPPLAGRLQVTAALPRRAILLTTVLAVLATLVNPHGPALLSYAVHVSSSGELANLIEEWQSPNFHDLYVLGLVLLPAVWIGGTLAFSGRRLALEDVVIALVLLVATLHAIRFLPYLVLAWCAVLARATPLRTETIRPTRLTLPLAAALAAVLLAGHHLPAGAPARGGGPDGTPVDAVAFLAHEPPGRVFATYWWSDYLMDRHVPVFVDGRTDLYFGTGILQSYVAVSSLEEDPDPVFKAWDVRYVLWNRDSALSVYLGHDPRWKVVDRSGDAVVFAHRGSW